MSMTFTKLFSSITESTIWREPANVRLVWITMLAMADRRGRVWASLPGLADRARVPDEDCRAAIKTFLSPDADSRTREHEGRRIEVIDGGWRLLNHEKYRAIRDEEAIKDSKRNYINKRRAAEKQANVENVERGRTPSNDVSECRANAEAEADAEAEEEREPSAPAAARPASSSEEVHHLFAEWNKLEGFSRVTSISDKRKRMLAARLRDSFFSQNWMVALGKLQASSFCRGENDRGWVANIEWFLKPDSCVKLIEGNFDNKKPHATHSKNPAEHPRNRHIAGSGTGPSTTEILRRRAEREAAERAAQAAERLPSPVGPVAGEVAPVEQYPSESFGSV